MLAIHSRQMNNPNKRRLLKVHLCCSYRMSLTIRLSLENRIHPRSYADSIAARSLEHAADEAAIVRHKTS